MREIKFRAWDNVSKKMIHHHPSMVIRFRGGVTDGSTTPNVELMQYTCLKDKNGKEIYEGDILDQHGVEFSEQNPQRREIVKWVSYQWTGIWQWNTAIVVGNIYENPGLLKGAV